MPIWASTAKAPSTPWVAWEKTLARREVTPRRALDPNKTLASSAASPVEESTWDCSFRKAFTPL